MPLTPQPKNPGWRAAVNWLWHLKIIWCTRIAAQGFANSVEKQVMECYGCLQGISLCSLCCPSYLLPSRPWLFARACKSSKLQAGKSTAPNNIYLRSKARARNCQHVCAIWSSSATSCSGADAKSNKNHIEATSLTIGAGHGLEKSWGKTAHCTARNLSPTNCKDYWELSSSHWIPRFLPSLIIPLAALLGVLIWLQTVSWPSSHC